MVYYCNTCKCDFVCPHQTYAHIKEVDVTVEEEKFGPSAEAIRSQVYFSACIGLLALPYYHVHILVFVGSKFSMQRCKGLHI